jgi:hypothetical protein
MKDLDKKKCCKCEYFDFKEDMYKIDGFWVCSECGFNAYLKIMWNDYSLEYSNMPLGHCHNCCKDSYNYEYEYAHLCNECNSILYNDFINLPYDKIIKLIKGEL